MIIIIIVAIAAAAIATGSGDVGGQARKIGHGEDGRRSVELRSVGTQPHANWSSIAGGQQRIGIGGENEKEGEKSRKNDGNRSW